MKKNGSDSVLFLCIFVSFVFMLIPALNHNSFAQNYLQGELLLDIKREFLPVDVAVDPDSNIVTNLASIDSLNAFYKCFSFEKLYKGKYSPVQGLYLLKFPDTLDIDQIFSSYLQDPHVRLLSRSYPTEPAIIPNDSLYLPDPPSRYPYQWAHNMEHMQSELGWDIATGYSTIVIMILDKGVDYWFHEFVGNIWQNLGEDYDGDGHTLEWDPINEVWVFDPGDLNAYDDDWNGYEDDLVGWDFDDDDENPECEKVYKGDHGDHVAGTSSAITNNLRGAAGTDWHAKVMIARKLTNLDCINGLAYAVDNGADVVNMSFGIPGFQSPSESLLFVEQIDSAYAHGLILVAAAGNFDEEKLYPPAVYDNVIAVAGTDSFDLKWGWSNYHTGVAVSAPFQNYGPGHDNKWWELMVYEWNKGTSISTPFVSGLAGLIKGQHEKLWGVGSIANYEVATVLDSSADIIDTIPGNEPYQGKLGAGRINTFKALLAISRGEVNNDHEINMADVLYLVDYILGLGPELIPVYEIGDVDCDGLLTFADVIILALYINGQTPKPPPCYRYDYPWN